MNSSPRPSTDHLIACARRELAIRRAVYPKRVAKGQMDPHEAEHQVACMAEILRILEDREPGLFREPREEGR